MNKHWRKIYYKLVSNGLFWSCVTSVVQALRWLSTHSRLWPKLLSRAFTCSLLSSTFCLVYTLCSGHSGEFTFLCMCFAFTFAKFPIFVQNAFSALKFALKRPSFRLNYPFLRRSSYSSHYRTPVIGGICVTPFDRLGASGGSDFCRVFWCTPTRPTTSPHIRDI